MTPTSEELEELLALGSEWTWHIAAYERLRAHAPALAAEVVRLRMIVAASRSIQAARQALASQPGTEGQGDGPD